MDVSSEGDRVPVPGSEREPLPDSRPVGDAYPTGGEWVAVIVVTIVRVIV